MHPFTENHLILHQLWIRKVFFSRNKHKTISSLSRVLIPPKCTTVFHALFTIPPPLTLKLSHPASMLSVNCWVGLREKLTMLKTLTGAFFWVVPFHLDIASLSLPVIIMHRKASLGACPPKISAQEPTIEKTSTIYGKDIPQIKF